MDNAFCDIRIFFSKTNRAKYISHLDLYRTIQRAVKRAKLPVWETQGFNRHIYLTFALPLSLGVEGLFESMDMRLLSDIPFDEVKERLNLSLKAGNVNLTGGTCYDGIRILSVTAPVMKHTMIKKARYLINTNLDIKKFNEFLKQEKIEIEKKTKKKGITVIDLKPCIEDIKIEDGIVYLTLPAGTEFNINPGLVIESYKRFNSLNEDSCIFLIKRIEILTAEGKIFR